jgi:hypothetical protein
VLRLRVDDAPGVVSEPRGGRAKGEGRKGAAAGGVSHESLQVNRNEERYNLQANKLLSATRRDFALKAGEGIFPPIDDYYDGYVVCCHPI